MSYLLPDDIWAVVGLAAACGAVGGLAWDVANQMRRTTRSAVVTGLDNRLSLPFLGKRDGRRVVDLGLLGPMLVGAIAAVVLVLLVARSGPDAEDTAKALLDISRDSAAGTGRAAAAAEAADNLGTEVDLATLIIVGVLAGVGGWPVLERLTGSLTKTIDALLGQTTEAASQAAQKALRDQADGSIGKGEVEKLERAVAAAVQEASPRQLA